MTTRTTSIGPAARRAMMEALKGRRDVSVELDGDFVLSILGGDTVLIHERSAAEVDLADDGFDNRGRIVSD